MIHTKLCAKCGLQPRIQWSKSYCRGCAQGFTNDYQAKKLKESLDKGNRIGKCYGCKKEKEIYAPMVYYCTDCSRAYFSSTEKTYRQRKFKWLRELKEGRPCTDCNLTYPHCCLEWDHIPERGEKKFNIGASVRQGYQQILEEVAKCELVCANCHKIRTWNRGHTDEIFER